MSSVANGNVLLFHMLKGGVDKQTRDNMGASIAGFLRATTKFSSAPRPLSESDALIIRQLEETGFADMGALLSPEDMDRIQRHFADKKLVFYNETFKEPLAVGLCPDDCPQDVRFAEWEQGDISSCPVYSRLAHDERLLSIAEAYLGAAPTITILTTWWSFPSAGRRGGMQNFHHDRDDFRCLKLMIYLTDVDGESGPHQFVERTHTWKAIQQFVARQSWTPNDYVRFFKWLEVHRKEDADVTSIFPSENIRTITAAKGSAFLVDTRGLHRGVPPLKSPRLAFEICYTLLPKFNGVYEAIKRPEQIEPTDRVARATRLFYC